MEFIDLKTPYQEQKERILERVHRVLAHGQYILGPEVEELEEVLARYVGVKYCITASSGTDTLLLALMALGVRPDDEVITTPFTFAATAEMIAVLGAKPVFVDIDPKTYMLDPRETEKAITKKTKAIVPVSLYGQCADFESINRIAGKHGLPVIEDGAQSFGATAKGKRSGALSTIGSTSFFPSKPLGAYGDGGALFTDDEEIAKDLRVLRVHGQEGRYNHVRVGINGRLDTLQAAILLAKFEKFDWEVQRRHELGARYSNHIKTCCPAMETPAIAEGNTHIYAQYTVQHERRNDIIERLKMDNIPTAIHYRVPLHLQPAYSSYGYRAGDFPNAEHAAGRVFSLPMHPYLREADQQRVVESLAAALCGNG